MNRCMISIANCIYTCRHVYIYIYVIHMMYTYEYVLGCMSIAILRLSCLPHPSTNHRPHERTFGSGHSLLRPPDFCKDAKHKGIGGGTWRRKPPHDAKVLDNRKSNGRFSGLKNGYIHPQFFWAFLFFFRSFFLNLLIC